MYVAYSQRNQFTVGLRDFKHRSTRKCIATVTCFLFGQTDNIPSTLHDETQISTLPLDEFSIMEERQPPSESAPVGGATGPSENHLHRAEEQG